MVVIAVVVGDENDLGDGASGGRSMSMDGFGGEDGEPVSGDISLGKEKENGYGDKDEEDGDGDGEGIGARACWSVWIAGACAVSERVIVVGVCEYSKRKSSSDGAADSLRASLPASSSSSLSSSSSSSSFVMSKGLSALDCLSESMRNTPSTKFWCIHKSFIHLQIHTSMHAYIHT